MTRILIVDDAVDTIWLLTHMLRNQGYEILPASSGGEALQVAAAERPDAILLDVMMPGMDGIEVCRRLKADERLAAIPVILTTARDLDEDIVEGLDAGADDYVTKPFSIRELLARAHAFLRRRQDTAPEVIPFGECRLDLAAHKLFNRGAEVPLTAKEFRLLAYFLERPGRALTRRDILNAVWGRSVIVTGRSVDRCVTTLRAKIEPDPHHPRHIQTIRDIGYRFQIEQPEV